MTRALRLNKINRRISREKGREILFYLLFTILPIVQFCIFYIGVNFKSVIMAFQSFDVNTGKYYWNNFDNFKFIFSISQYRGLYPYMLRNSLITICSSLFIGIPLGLIFSYFMYKKGPMHKLFRITLFLPTIISSVVLTMLFRAFVERFIPGLYGSPIGFLSKDANTQFITLIVYNIFVSFGSSTLLYTGAMNGISPSVMEAAKIDGARPFREFISVVFPMVFSTVSVFIITTVSGFLSNQLYEYTFFQKTITFPTNQTFGYFIYWNTVVSPDQASLPIWATYGFLFSLITIPLVFFIRWLLNKVKNIW